MKKNVIKFEFRNSKDAEYIFNKLIKYNAFEVEELPNIKTFKFTEKNKNGMLIKVGKCDTEIFRLRV